MENKSNRARRLFAFLIDFTFLYISSIVSTVVLQLPLSGYFSMFVVSIVVIASFVVFLLRDYLFNGRSIGKRILKLRVVDADTLSAPSSKQLIVRNLFFFLYPVDCLSLISSGKSLGEKATCTVVLHEQQFLSADSPEISRQSGTSVKKRINVAATVVLCISIPLFLIISFALDAVKKQENYQIAHAYLVGSKVYAEMQVDESQIALVGHSLSTKIDSDGDTASTVATFTFLIRGQQYQVVCHQNRDIWYVCNDCTDFQ